MIFVSSSGFTFSKPLRRALLLLVGLCALIAQPASSHSREVQKLKTPGGIGVWLVEDHGIPIVALGFAMRGGSVLDAPGKEGTGHLFANMLDEGAGELDADTFKDRLEAVGSQLVFAVSRKAFSGGLVTLSKHLDASAQLLKLALQDPHLNTDDFARAKQQEIASIAFENRDPAQVAIRRFYEQAFAGHPYARPPKGTPETLGALTVEDIRAHGKKLIGKSNLHVVLVGAIDAGQAAELIDDIFGALPKGESPKPVTPVSLKPMMSVVPALPGTKLETAIFALPTPDIDDPQFFTAIALNQIVGSGNFDARLTKELRIKRGLTYSVASQIVADRASSIALGVVSTQPGKMDETLKIARTVLSQLQSDGPTPTELENAKSSLNGAYLLGLDTSARLADHLLGLWIDGLPANYGEKRKDGLNSVTKPEADRVAKILFDPNKLSVLIMSPSEGER